MPVQKKTGDTHTQKKQCILICENNAFTLGVTLLLKLLSYVGLLLMSLSFYAFLHDSCLAQGRKKIIIEPERVTKPQSTIYK